MGDIIDKVKELIKGKPEIEIIEGAPDAYDKVKSLTDKQLEQYIGIDPMQVPREVQEELYQRFVSPHAHFGCKTCHGRGHDGWNVELHQLQPCVCLQKVIRKDQEGKNAGYLYDLNGNKINFNQN